MCIGPENKKEASFSHRLSLRTLPKFESTSVTYFKEMHVNRLNWLKTEDLNRGSGKVNWSSYAPGNDTL